MAPAVLEKKELIKEAKQAKLFFDASEKTFIDFCKVLDVNPLDSPWIDDFGCKLNQFVKQNLDLKINTLSLFSGAGGLDIGFHDAGFNIVQMVEIEKQFVKTLQTNFSKKLINCIDIREFYPKITENIDFIIGGPPCQTFSAAGRRAAGVLGTTDSRGTLFQEYVRLLNHFQPKGFLFENVYGITGAENGSAWQSIQAAFRDIGYTIFSTILDAADYGVPQHRERLFIVGVRDGGNFNFPLPTHGPDSNSNIQHYSAREALQGVNCESNQESGLNGRYGHLLNEIPPGLNYSFFTEKMGHPRPVFAWRSKFSDFLYKADPETPIRTLKAQGGQYTGPFHWQNRPFSTSELKRLQTFPDTYEVIGGRQIAIKQIGNSVPPQLSRILAISILQQIFKVSLPVNIPLIPNGTQLTFRQRKRSLTQVYFDKAQEAIKVISPRKIEKNKIKPLNFQASLCQKFKLSTGTLKGDFTVQFKPLKSKWEVAISSNIKKKRGNGFQILIETSVGEKWGLPVNQIVISSNTAEDNLYTASWKTLEFLLQKFELKADLVQLNQYYQYTPEIRIKLTFDNEEGVDHKWKILQAICSGESCREVIPLECLKRTWGLLSENKTKEMLQWLKDIGYEVRNHSTNPQLPKGSYLIPYSFPTLTMQSVQLRKML